MYTLYSIESSFILYAIILQLLFALITFSVSLVSYKVYRITQNTNTKSMVMAFLFVCGSYGIQAIFNFLILLRVRHSDFVMFGIHPLSVLNEQGLYLHVVFMAVGLSILMYNAFKTKTRSLLWYLILSSLMILFVSRNILTGFFMLTSLYLGFLAFHYYVNFQDKKTKGAFLITSAFSFLFVGNLMFVVMSASTFFYSLGHLFQFIGYILILVNYYIIQK
jgi:hypothetical protein